MSWLNISTWFRNLQRKILSVELARDKVPAELVWALIDNTRLVSDFWGVDRHLRELTPEVMQLLQVWGFEPSIYVCISPKIELTPLNPNRTLVRKVTVDLLDYNGYDNCSHHIIQKQWDTGDESHSQNICCKCGKWRRWP